ncbi:MAG: metal-dependent hydrolase [Chloroflexi bacterium]|nr:metal-dependent hydrolase [Chloroflexota bacterium]MBU1746381.1 metal-dependent hydrolase [Chloroflexota bacterium]
MKGITHFVSGVAVASFFPEAVYLAADNLSQILVLGGIFGILPDTLDFKFARFFEGADVEIDPHPDHPDPQAMAETVAATIDRAHETGNTTSVQFHTVKLGADLWRLYSIFFDTEAGDVVVRMGSVVTTSQVPFPGSELDVPAGRAKTAARLIQTYDAETKVDIFSGPSMEFTPTRDGAIEIVFLPWHRRWSHSLTLSALFGVGMFLVGTALGWLGSPGDPATALGAGALWGLIAGLASVAHVVEDQLGHMGSNLFYPFTKKRTQGLKFVRSGDAIPNFLTVWTGLVIVLFNLDRFSAAPILDPVSYFAMSLVIPAALLLAGDWITKRWQGRKKRSEGALVAAEAVAFSEEVELA